MAKIFGYSVDLTEEQADQLLLLTGNDRTKTLQFINLLYAHERNIKNRLLDESSIQNRRNYTGEYVRRYFNEYDQAHPDQTKMQKIQNVSLELGITSKAVEKHLYKK